MISLNVFVYVSYVYALLFGVNIVYGLRKFDKKDLHNLREEVRQMFQHAYNSYLKYAYPYDELRPLSCDGVDTWGSYSLTLIDALDTLAVMGNYTEFQRVVGIVTTHANFDANINVSVFETNIRIIGGLLSAHLLSYRAGMAVEPGWPCNGPLLQLAEDVARRLISAFDTATGMPYGTVNLRHGVPEGETSVTCTAGVGTFILELGTLSRLTGDPLFEEIAMNALHALYHHRSPIGLVGNHIDVQTGRWTAQDAGIGAGVDSYYEYLAKGAILLQRPELMHMFNEGRAAIDKYLKRDDWHLWVSMSKGQVTLPVFQSLEAYWPGVLSLIGDVNKGMKSLHNYHQVWRQYGFTPEFYNIPQGEVGSNRESYPLRPELIESVMYLYRATGDQYLLEVGKDILRSIQHSAKTPCGYATIKDVRDHRKEDRMESFFLAETTKYLYLLFDPDNFIHNRGQHGTVVKTPWGECVLEAGGYIFNTEAHPIDPGALHCCSGHRHSDVEDMLSLGLDKEALRGHRLSTLRRNSAPPRPWPTTPRGPSHLDTHDMEMTSINAQKERTEFLKQLVSEMGEAIDVIRLSSKEMEDEKWGNDVSKVKLKQRSKTESADGNKVRVTNLKTESKPQELNDRNSLKEPLGVGRGTWEAESNRTNQSGNVKDNLVAESIGDVSTSSFEGDRIAKVKEGFEYRADDSDKVYSLTNPESQESQVNLSEKVNSAEVDGSYEEEKQSDDLETWGKEMANDHSGLPAFVSQFLFAKSKVKPPFDPQALLERLREEVKYSRNITWEQNFQLLSCAAQPFLQRLSMSGEIFDSS